MTQGKSFTKQAYHPGRPPMALKHLLTVPSATADELHRMIAAAKQTQRCATSKDASRAVCFIHYLMQACSLLMMYTVCQYKKLIN